MPAHAPRPSLPRIVAFLAAFCLVAVVQVSLPSPAAARSTACTRMVHVDHSGRTDVTAALQRFINASRNGAVICFARGGKYLVNGTLHVKDRAGLLFEGRDATIFQTRRSTSRIWLIDGNSRDIWLRHMTIRGANPRPGVWNPTYEHNHGIQVGGAVRLHLGHLRIVNVGGDGLYLAAGRAGSGVRWASSVHFHHSIINGTGRSGVSIADGAKNVVIDYNQFRRIAYYTFNIEPNGMVWGGVAAGARNVRFSHNVLGTQPYGTGKGGQPVGHVFVVTGSSGGGPADAVTINANVIHGRPFDIGVFNNGGLRRNIRVIGNRSDTRAAGPVMHFNGVRTLVVRNNRQPLSRGSLVQASACTDVLISGNVIR
jgi:hypothetical protein